MGRETHDVQGILAAVEGTMEGRAGKAGRRGPVLSSRRKPTASVEKWRARSYSKELL